jgi:hypothetical protein
MLTTSPPSCAACLEIWEPQPPGTPRTRNWPVQGISVPFSMQYLPPYLTSFHLNNLFSDTLRLCIEPSFTLIPGYGPCGVAQKNDDRLQAGLTTLARCFRFF